MAIEASPQLCLCLLWCGGSLGEIPYVLTTPGVWDAGSGLSEGPEDGGLLLLDRPFAPLPQPQAWEVWLCENLSQE